MYHEIRASTLKRLHFFSFPARLRYELFCADNTFSLFYLECTQLLYPEVQAIWYGAAGENFDIFMLEIPSEKRFWCK